MNLPIQSSRPPGPNERRLNDLGAGFRGGETIDVANVGGIVERHRQELTRQLRVVALAAVILSACIVTAALWRAQAAAAWRVELVRQESLARDCLGHGDARCARDTFSLLLHDDPTFPGARDGLESARTTLAEQLAEAGQFREAVGELDATLSDNPGDRTATDQLRAVFDRWYEDALGRGDWLTAVSVDRQRRARFPQTPTPISQATA